MVRRAFDEGLVKVDGKRTRKNHLPRVGALLEAQIPEDDLSPLPRHDLPLQVLYEDSALVVLNKPAGMSVHPLVEGDRQTLANALVARYPECAEASQSPRECGFAHRLDHDTSGVIVAARERATFDALRRAFSSRAVEKRYLALVGGAPGEEGMLELPIGHHPSNVRKMVVCTAPEDAARLKARPALTRYRLRERLGDLALLDVEIPTGVTHQIRVHLAALGAPVAGDPLYGGPSVEGLAHHFLHASLLSLSHPRTGATLCVEAPLPPELGALLDTLRARR